MKNRIFLTEKRWEEFIHFLVFNIWNTKPNSKERIGLIEKFFKMPIEKFERYKEICKIKHPQNK